LTPSPSALRLGSDELPLTASIGVAATSQSGTASQELVRRADVAMYRAKARGGGCWVRFDERMADDVEAQLQVESELRLALARDELRCTTSRSCASTTGPSSDARRSCAGSTRCAG